MRATRVLSWLSVMAFIGAAACGDGGSGDGDGDDGTDGSDIDAGTTPGDPDASIGDDVIDLILGDWTMNGGTEGYVCVYKTLEQDIYFNGIEAIAPPGTHHTVLTVGNPTRADGTVGCNAGTNYNQMLYASGVGTDPFTFPPGVGIKVEAGQQLLLNLHLFNFTDEQISGTSGNRVNVIQAADMEFEAESILMGKVAGLEVIEGPSTQTGRCNMNGDTNIFAMIPHMHMLGTHMKVTAQSTEMGEVVIHDKDYNFDLQRVDEMEPIVPMKQGDTLIVECSYNNTTGGPVYFGDSSLEEMCFAITFRYPAYGGTFGIICDNPF